MPTTGNDPLTLCDNCEHECSKLVAGVCSSYLCETPMLRGGICGHSFSAYGQMGATFCPVCHEQGFLKKTDCQPFSECCQCRDNVFGDSRGSYCEPCADRSDRQSERNYEAFCEAFYGGEIETLDQQHRILHEEKRRLS